MRRSSSIRPANSAASSRCHVPRLTMKEKARGVTTFDVLAAQRLVVEVNIGVDHAISG